MGVGCIPQPPAPTPAGPGGGPPGGDGGSGCSFTNLGACISDAVDGYFRALVASALNPLLELLSRTLLTTPTPASIPALGQLWAGSWRILLACYGLLVVSAGVLLMAYETLQARYSLKEIAPRIVVGFLAGALSMWISSQAIEIANSVSQAVLGEGLDPDTVVQSLRTIVGDGLRLQLFTIFVGLFLAVLLFALLVGYVIRVAITIILIAGAPIALMFHALPQTEGIAYWWWRAFGGCLAIQVVQSLTLITALRVFLAPGGFAMFWPTTDGLVNMLVAVALMYILFKIPFWVLHSIRGGGRRSLIGSLVRGFIAYKAFGLLGGRGGSTRGPRRPGGGRRGPEPSGGPGGGPNGGPGGGSGPGDPYAHPRTTGDGQYVLPLGVRRTRAAHRPPSTTSRAPGSPRGQGRQLELPLGDDWPENKPVLGPDGQYRLPLRPPRTRPPRRPPPGPTPSGSASPAAGPGRGRQLVLPLREDWPETRPVLGRDGQYRLPLNVRRDRSARPPTPAAPPPLPLRRGQLVLPLGEDWPENRPVLGRDGQYRLPITVNRVPRATPPTPVPAPPARTSRPVEQLRLPLTPPPPAARTTPEPAPMPPRAGARLRPPVDLPMRARPAARTPAKPVPRAPKPRRGGNP